MWLPSGVMTSCSLLSYIDRQTLAVLSPMIIAETDLTDASYGDAVSAFSIAYMIGNPLWGSLLDHVGLRIGMLLAVALWTAASASHAFVFGFLGFAAARAVLGFGEGAAFPGAMRTAVVSLPPEKQGRGIGLGYSGASLGALLTPVLVTPFALRFGWRTAFIVTGFLGLAWLALWWSIARPPFLPEHYRPERPRIPNLFERRCWVVVSSFGFGGVALAVVAYMSPLYLNRALSVTQAELGKILWIPMVGWEAGYFFWGWVADRWVPPGTGKRPAWVFLLLSALALPSALVTFTDSLAVVLGLFLWSTFVADGFVVMSLRVGSHIYPRDQVGVAGGIGSAAWSAVAAIVVPVYARFVEQQSYTAIFVSMSLLPLFGTLLWLWISRPAHLWRGGR
jgi:ACS family hexuronate transporter-like MFS transporter